MKYLAFAEAAIISVVAIFAPIQSLLITTGVLILVDLITGIWSSIKRGEPITSAGLRRTLTKLFVYEAALMVAFLVEHYMSDILPFVKMSSAMVSIVELKSVYENLNNISGADLLKSLIDKLGSSNQQRKE